MKVCFVTGVRIAGVAVKFEMMAGAGAVAVKAVGPAFANVDGSIGWSFAGVTGVGRDDVDESLPLVSLLRFERGSLSTSRTVGG